MSTTLGSGSSLLISGATIIDGVEDRPIQGCAVWIEGNRIRAIDRYENLRIPPGTQTIDARDKYLIPGLMNANVHLWLGIFPLGDLLRYNDRAQDVVAEAAQVALKNGLTTVFDTMGARKPLIAVRERINAGELVGSRIFCAGWIVGLDGIFSLDFNPNAAPVLDKTIVEYINAQCAENVGPALSWMTPEQVAKEIRRYIGKGVDFIKYAANEHRWGDATTSLVFSPRAQAAIVEEAHRSGVTVQAHTSSVEGLRAAVEAGCDLIQHCNITGPFPIPEETLKLMVERRTGAVVFPFTQQRFDWIMGNCEIDRAYFSTSDVNCRNLLRAGAMLLLANDGTQWGPSQAADPLLSTYWSAPGDDNLNPLDQGHFVWLKAMEEKGTPAMELLRAATRNIAVAYGKEKDLGTLEPGKIADMVILDRNPLTSAENYRSIHMVLKDGVVVDRSSLPTNPVLTRPLDPPTEEVLDYRAHRHIGRSGFPMCPMCVPR
ncbi:amidohydrolase family protein [Peristeroidobacter soli]|uniref:amidohydrolase family protein n=1 Tax=Peristeroidobacter soli TaxID=2497877 RepID=UPI00101C9632|nr:amidohydrolase family protein [Peristeroidobacter soli]